MLPKVKSEANLDGISTNTGKNANELNRKNSPKKNKIAKFFQFSAAVYTSYILVFSPVI